MLLEGMIVRSSSTTPIYFQNSGLEENAPSYTAVGSNFWTYGTIHVGRGSFTSQNPTWTLPSVNVLIITVYYTLSFHVIKNMSTRRSYVFVRVFLFFPFNISVRSYKSSRNNTYTTISKIIFRSSELLNKIDLCNPMNMIMDDINQIVLSDVVHNIIIIVHSL